MEIESISREEDGFTPSRVMNISEEALYLKGPEGTRLIVEIGNMMYRNEPPIFEYDPRVHLLSIGGKQLKHEEIIDSRELYALHDWYGYIPLERALGDKPLKMVGSEFEWKFYKEHDEILRKIRLINSFAKIYGVDIPDNSRRHIAAATRVSEHYSPEDYLRVVIDDLDESLERLGREPLGKSLEALGIYDTNLAVARKNIVAMFYLFMDRLGLDGSDQKDIREALEKLKGESSQLLLDEYRTRPDGRFGDELLGAFSEFDQPEE